MRAFFRGVWAELVKPRGSVRHRFYRVGRSSRAGVALLLVMTSIMLLSILVGEIAHDATVRMRMASHYRNEVKAEAIAHSGVNLYRLILMVSKQLGQNPMISMASELLGINADQLWQAIPFFNTSMLRMVLVNGDSVDEDDVDAYRAEGLSDEEEAESREDEGAKHNFLDFDGDFNARVIDENRFIFVGNLQAATMADLLQLPATQQLLGLMNKEEHNEYFYREDLERMELIGNLVDWTDTDNTRLYQGGLEDSIYERLDEPYRAKNAPFDTTEEIRLVDGWHKDGVWQRFGQFLTIYGGGKVNVNTATRPVLRALLMAYAEVPNEFFVDQVLDQFLALRGMPRSLGGFHATSASEFVSAIQTLGLVLRQDAANGITTDSSTYRVVCEGEVGDAKVEINAVFDFSRNATGEVLYWATK